MEELKIGTKRDLGEGFFVEVTRICKDMSGHVDVVFSNGRRILYLKNKLFWKLDFNDKRNSRVKDRTGETLTRSDGTRLTIINYVDCNNVDILVTEKGNRHEVLVGKNIKWFTTGLYEDVPYSIRRYGKLNRKSKESSDLELRGVIGGIDKSTKEKSFDMRVEDVVGKTYNTSVGKALLVSCSRHGATVVDMSGIMHRLELEDVQWNG